MAGRKRSSASPIRDADDLIDEATKRLASITAASHRCSASGGKRRTKDLREQVDAVRRRRDRARMELLEIVELAETPVETDGVGLTRRQFDDNIGLTVYRGPQDCAHGR